MLWLAPLGACVTYSPDHADVATVAAEAAQRQGGTFTLERAFTTALSDNPALLAAESRARAAGAMIQPLTLQSEWRSGTEMLGVMLDPVAVLGLGPRGGATGRDEALAAQAAAQLVAERWRVLGEIAEAFAVDYALAPLTSPTIDVRTGDFRAAGLAAPVAATRLEAGQQAAVAERAALARDRIDNLARLRALLGLSATASLQLVHDAQPWRDFATGDETLLQRPDLTLATSRWQVADAEFRQAVADQYPSLMIGPEFPLRGGPLEAMAVLRVPLLQHGPAASARERRQAAREDLLEAFLQVVAEATSADSTRTATEAQRTAAAARQRASETALQAALVAVQVEVDAFGELAEAAVMAVEDTRMLREISIVAARAQVRAAVAHGWPAITAEVKS
ncbi:MAG: hypothetical protein KDC48_03560 [Planctomycetes bacterium]|nr:hypothetical protein [Planctomycetota bacterium]